MLEIRDLHFSYQDRKVLSGLNLNVNRGEVISLLGASGSGKTTLFSCISGLISCDDRSILFEKAPPFVGNPRLGYMMQEDLLLPWRTVKDNILLSQVLGRSGKLPSKISSLSELLENLGLSGRENCFPHELSGGMKKRAALARAIYSDPPFLLLDEPFGGLDVVTKHKLYEFLKEWQKKGNKTLIMITHDLHDALTLSDSIYILKEGKLDFTPPQKELSSAYFDMMQALL